MSNHIAAKPGEIAKTVLMPGDPLRSKYIAEHYLENARLVNNIRGGARAIPEPVMDSP